MYIAKEKIKVGKTKFTFEQLVFLFQRSVRNGTVIRVHRHHHTLLQQIFDRILLDILISASVEVAPRADLNRNFLAFEPANYAIRFNRPNPVSNPPSPESQRRLDALWPVCLARMDSKRNSANTGTTEKFCKIWRIRRIISFVASQVDTANPTP